MQTSLVLALHGVPSSACSPQGTMTVSFASVQYSSHGSAEKFMNKNVSIISGRKHEKLLLKRIFHAYMTRSTAAKCSFSRCMCGCCSGSIGSLWMLVGLRGKDLCCRCGIYDARRCRICHPKRALDGRIRVAGLKRPLRTIGNIHSSHSIHPNHHRLLLAFPRLGHILDFDTTETQEIKIKLSEILNDLVILRV